MYSGKLIIVAMISLSILFVQTQADFEDDILSEHNKYRANHGCPKLELSASLSAECQTYAETLASNDDMVHSDGEYGENLCYVSSDPVNCVKMWYDEVKDYNYKNPKYSTKTGHFTQVIWKSSKTLGVGKKKSASRKIYVVARYIPGGNVVGAFKSNVPKPINQSYKASISEYLTLFLCILPVMFAKFI